MRGAPAVSVVISTYNRASSLASTLQSLAPDTQTPTSVHYEVIVVDNNSTDDTSAVIRGFVDSHPDVYRYVFEAKQGVSHGRNAGIREASAPIVAFTDDDNAAEPSWVATLKDALDRHPEAAAVGGRVLPRWEGAVPGWLDRRHWSPLAILDYGSEEFYTSASNPRCLLTANLAVRREWFSTIGDFSSRYPRCQDHELQVRLWRAGARALYVPAMCVRARVSPERMTERYHRTWHQTHGSFTASMQLLEIIDRSGSLLQRPVDAPRLRGTPGFVFLAVASHARGWAISALSRDRGGMLAHEHRLRYLSAYIRQAARLPQHEAGWLRDSLTFLQAHARKRLAPASVSLQRAVVAQALFVVIAGASAYDIATGTEHWPFSPYPMFSRVERQSTLDSLRVFGVTDEAHPREIPLLDGRLIAPFDQTRLSTAMARTADDPDRRALLGAMLRDCLDRYERLRASGEHHGPALRGIRLYDERWTLDPEAANVDTPDRRRLIAEASSPARSTAN